jgi:uncharacterized ferritin-like protein (DUF455 family)
VARLWQQVLEQGFDHQHAAPPAPISRPGRPATPLLVHPQKVPRRRLGSAEGRAALVHAVAHIEFNAINLALDAAYRFRGMPEQYYLDWLSVAADEARHFLMLEQRLAAMGHAYGDFPAHNGLWEMAERTAQACLQRMALVPRVLEARGLDVTPGMIERLRSSGDLDTVAALEVILEEEVRHVEIGSHWFGYCCALAGLEPQATFLQLLESHYEGRIKGPFNTEARRRAGFSAAEMDALEQLG